MRSPVGLVMATLLVFSLAGCGSEPDTGGLAEYTPAAQPSNDHSSSDTPSSDTPSASAGAGTAAQPSDDVSAARQELDVQCLAYERADAAARREGWERSQETERARPARIQLTRRQFRADRALASGLRTVTVPESMRADLDALRASVDRQLTLDRQRVRAAQAGDARLPALDARRREQRTAAADIGARLGACAFELGDSDRSAITEVLRTYETSAEAAVVCQEVLTGPAVQREYGGAPPAAARRCRGAVSKERASGRAREIEVNDLTGVPELSAVASYRIVGGPADGQARHASLLMRAGRWRVWDVHARHTPDSADSW